MTPSTSTTAALFSAGAASYAAHRPTYPQELYAHILHLAKLPAHELAVDVGCGSGQATKELALRFRHVIGIDGNQDQLDHAAQAPNIEYKFGDAHATGVDDGVADLVTVAQAVHWFDLPRFYTEARRLLKPHGALALWTYQLSVLEAPEHPANAALQWLYHDVVGPYWAPQRLLVDNGYADVLPGPEHFGAHQRVELTMDSVQSIDQVVGHCASWSGYHTYRKAHPEAPDPLLELRRRLQQACEACALPAAVACAEGGCGEEGAAGGGVAAAAGIHVRLPLLLFVCTGPVK